MRKNLAILVSLGVLSGICGTCGTAAQANEHGSGSAGSQRLCETLVPRDKMSRLGASEREGAAVIGCAVAAWQLAANEDLSYIEYQRPESSYDRGWVKATFYIGLDRFAAATNDRRLLARVRQFAFDTGLELGDRPWHGDDQAVAAVYANVALRDGDPTLIRKTAEQFDHIIAQNYTGSLEFTKPTVAGKEGDCQKRWCWADAIFMAPPAWALTTRVTGDPRYLDYAARETRAVIEYLQDPKTGLLFRDSRYFEAKTPNGKPVVWSRGNGWVFAGLARFIEAMPDAHADRPMMVEAFRTLAARLVKLQRKDGYWPTSLLDPDMFKNPETSGTAFFGFGLAWGLNNGVLKGSEYVSARDRAWDAVRRAIDGGGKVGWVQQIGKDPQLTTAETSQLYAAGGVLLFASEMLNAD